VETYFCEVIISGSFILLVGLVSGLAIGPFMNIYTATVAVFGESKTVETCITLERTVTLTKSTTVFSRGNYQEYGDLNHH